MLAGYEESGWVHPVGRGLKWHHLSVGSMAMYITTLALWLNNTISGIVAHGKDCGYNKDFTTAMFLTTHFVREKQKKKTQLFAPAPAEKINLHVHTMEHSAAIKKFLDTC